MSVTPHWSQNTNAWPCGRRQKSVASHKPVLAVCGGAKRKLETSRQTDACIHHHRRDVIGLSALIMGRKPGGDLVRHGGETRHHGNADRKNASLAVIRVAMTALIYSSSERMKFKARGICLDLASEVAVELSETHSNLLFDASIRGSIVFVPIQLVYSHTKGNAIQNYKKVAFNDSSCLWCTT